MTQRNASSDVLAYDIDKLAAVGGPGRSLAYSEIAAGRLRAIKVGRRTKVLARDLRAYLDSCPAMAPKPSQVNAQQEALPA